MGKTHLTVKLNKSLSFLKFLALLILRVAIQWKTLGGPKGFSDVIWEMKKIEKDAEDPTIVFAYHSKDGDEG